MEALFIVMGFMLLSGLLGYVAGKYGSRRSNPYPHRLADSWYYVFYPDGEPCALTDEAVQEGKIRAQRLKIK